MRGLVGKCLFGGLVAGLTLLGVAPGILFPLLEGYLVIEPTLQRADALVLMAGSPAERVPVLVRLYQEGVAPRILLTNDGVLGAWSTEHQRNLYHVEWAEVELLKRQIPQAAIVKLAFSASGTIHDALHTRDHVLADGGIRSLVVVTSDYHTRRTLWTFKEVFSGDPVALRVYPAASLPQRGMKDNLVILTTELVKLMFYRVRYGDLLSPG